MQLEVPEMACPWYSSFFDQDYLQFYAEVSPPELAAREVDFFVEQLRLVPPARVLDLACGDGRHCLELARRGFEVTGLDLSEAALAQGRRAADLARLKIRWIRSDLRGCPFEREFQACLLWGNSFGYLESDEEDRKSLCAVGRALRPGGSVLLDTLGQPALMRDLVPRSWTSTPSGWLVLERLEYDPSSGRLLTEVVFLAPDGRRRTARHEIRIYTLVELTALMSRAGVPLSGTFGNIDRTPYSAFSHRLIVRGTAAEEVPASRPNDPG